MRCRWRHCGHHFQHIRLPHREDDGWTCSDQFLGALQRATWNQHIVVHFHMDHVLLRCDFVFTIRHCTHSVLSGAYINRHPDGYAPTNQRFRAQFWIPLIVDAKSTLCFGTCNRCNSCSCKHPESDLTALVEIERAGKVCMTLVDPLFSGAIFELSKGVRNPLMHWTKKADCVGESVTLNMAFYGCNSAKEMLELLKKQDFCKSSAWRKRWLGIDCANTF